jgi:hypothetical protein
LLSLIFMKSLQPGIQAMHGPPFVVILVGGVLPA